jgi:hypothetical protein
MAMHAQDGLGTTRDHLLEQKASRPQAVAASPSFAIANRRPCRHQIESYAAEVVLVRDLVGQDLQDPPSAKLARRGFCFRQGLDDPLCRGNAESSEKRLGLRVVERARGSVADIDLPFGRRIDRPAARGENAGDAAAEDPTLTTRDRTD